MKRDVGTWCESGSRVPLKIYISGITYFRDYCSLHCMTLRKLDIGDQAMYSSRVMMQCLDQSTRMMPDLVVVILGVETDFWPCY